MDVKISFCARILVFLFIFKSNILAQNVKSIDSLIAKIDRIQFTETIFVVDSPKVNTRPKEIIGYLNEGKLLKSLAKYHILEGLKLLTMKTKTSYM